MTNLTQTKKKSVGAIVEKRFEYKGFPCVVIMQSMAFRTGYVGIPKGHKLYGKYYNEDYSLENIECNGGLTYSCDYLFGQNDKDTWWIGYDCGHCWNGYAVDDALELFRDYPGNIERIKHNYEQGIYDMSWTSEIFITMTLQDCEEECKRIVDQILQMEEK